MKALLSTLSRLRWPARASTTVQASTLEWRLRELVEQHLDAMHRTALRLGVGSGDADDVVQETLVVLARRLGEVTPGRERAFALATTARVAANFRRAARRRREAPFEAVPSEDAATSAQAQVLSVPATAERSVQASQALQLLDTALNEMTEAQRVTFVLFELEELSAREIASQLGVAEAAVTSRLGRARTVLRRAFQRQEREEKRVLSRASVEATP